MMFIISKINLYIRD